MLTQERLRYLDKIALLEEEETVTRQRLAYVERLSAEARERRDVAPDYVYSAIGHFHTRLNNLRSSLTQCRSRLLELDAENPDDVARC